MKKKFLIFIFLFLFTGCRANYKIEVLDGIIHEEFFVFANKDTLTNKSDDLGMTFNDYAMEYGNSNKIYTNYYNMYGDMDTSCQVTDNNSCDVYHSEYINDDENVGFKLSSSFKFNDYVNATIPNDLLPNFSSTYDGRYLTISGSSDLDFFNGYDELDEINVTVSSIFYPIATNAQDKGNGVYEWTITKDTILSENLYIVLDTTSIRPTVSSTPWNVVLLCCGVVLIIGLVIIVKLVNMKKKNNVI